MPAKRCLKKEHFRALNLSLVTAVTALEAQLCPHLSFLLARTLLESKTPDLCRILLFLLDILDIGHNIVCRGAPNLISDAAQMSEHEALCGAESC